MITHRLATHSPEPPVKFYKIIALTFLLITVALLGVVIFVTSKKADITIITKEDNSNVSLSVTVNSDGRGASAIKGVVTSTVFFWSKNYQPTGTKKVEGVSKGAVIIYNKTGSNQVLVKTTRLLTSGGVLFRLSEGTMVPANGQVNVPVYADKAGAAYDIGPSVFTIPGLNVDKQKFIYAESKQTMMGGSGMAGVLSADDINNAKKNFQEEAAVEFLARLNDDNLAGKEKIITMGDKDLSVSAQAGDEVSLFTVSGSSAMVVVAYNSDDLLDLVNKEAAKKIDYAAEKFLSLNKKPLVEVGAYNVEKGVAELTVRQEAVVTLDANAAKLSADNFLGKKKDEIQRYILSLEHVAGVDVKFSPSWMLTAPSVPDKIRIVVKNVE